MKNKSKYSEPDNSRRVPDPKKGKYADAHRLDEVKYLECKLIFKGDRFTAESNFDDFGKIVKRAAEAAEVGFSRICNTLPRNGSPSEPRRRARSIA